ncbi:MAG: putative permease [Kiritimatiellia bacterium]|jgi:putative permease
MQLLFNWFKRTFNDPQVVILAVLLVFGFIGITFLGDIMAPCFAAIVIAYLLEGLVTKLQYLKIPRLPAVLTVYTCFLAFFIIILLGLMPYVAQQSIKLLQRMPTMIETSQNAMLDYIEKRSLEKKAAVERLPSTDPSLAGHEPPTPPTVPVPAPVTIAIPPPAETNVITQVGTNTVTNVVAVVTNAVPGKKIFSFPPTFPSREPPTTGESISEEQIKWVTNLINERLVKMGDFVAKRITDWGKGLITLVVYMILVPILIFFFLKDKEKIRKYLANFLPDERPLAAQVWREVDQQLGNYVRGKFWEIIIVWGVTYSVFSLIGLQYAMLLAVFTGLSVLIPYIGATVMTIPVALIAYFQYGDIGSGFAWAVGAYLIIQLLDGNLLAPLLLSEVTNLHPIAIIGAILFFGGLFGFWGVFFAIPLATLVQAVINAWPRKHQVEPKPDSDPPPDLPLEAA